ncbi:hypothetical protein PBAC_28340 [Pedobacter glucosidilyticus]|nr:hypothetical protein PBAC_28340 [Pedobacter glucosidilyticus]
MDVIFSPRAVEDLKYWKKSGNKAIQTKIQEIFLRYKKIPTRG